MMVVSKETENQEENKQQMNATMHTSRLSPELGLKTLPWG